MIQKLYPKGKKKAFNITYDDGVTQDIRFVELLNKYGVKGTFNLNSELMRNGFEWTHETGLVIKRLPPEVAVGSLMEECRRNDIPMHRQKNTFIGQQVHFILCQDLQNL